MCMSWHEVLVLGERKSEMIPALNGASPVALNGLTVLGCNCVMCYLQFPESITTSLFQPGYAAPESV